MLMYVTRCFSCCLLWSQLSSSGSGCQCCLVQLLLHMVLHSVHNTSQLVAPVLCLCSVLADVRVTRNVLK